MFRHKRRPARFLQLRIFVMTSERPAYQSYLLRLWRVANDGQPIWHASLEHPTSGERRGFSGLEALFMFLRSECAPMSEVDAEDDIKTES